MVEIIYQYMFGSNSNTHTNTQTHSHRIWIFASVCKCIVGRKTFKREMLHRFMVALTLVHSNRKCTLTSTHWLTLIQNNSTTEG